MARLIDADALLNRIEVEPLTFDGGIDINDLERIIKQQPTIEPKQANDLISRADAMAYPLSWEHYDKEHGSRQFISGVESYREYIEYLPSAQPKQGEWINRYCGDVWVEQYCSVCGTVIEDEPMDYNYCPNCGARMKGADDE